MKNIVTLKANTPMVGLKNLSDFAGVKYNSTRDLITKHSAELKILGFNLVGKSDLKSDFMDEYQAAFLMTLMKNTPVVVKFKLDLMLQFKALREKEMLKMEKKLLNATSLKTYKYGQVSLRKYLKESGSSLLEEDAWQELEDLRIIETKVTPSKTRHLIDFSVGSQSQKTLSFDVGELNKIFGPFGVVSLSKAKKSAGK